MTNFERLNLLEWLAAQTKVMREMQREYFKSRHPRALTMAKAAEASVDATINKLFPPAGPLI